MKIKGSANHKYNRMIGVYLSQQTRFGHHTYAAFDFSNSLNQLFAYSFSTLQGTNSTHVVRLLSSWTKENRGFPLCLVISPPGPLPDTSITRVNGFSAALATFLSQLTCRHVLMSMSMAKHLFPFHPVLAQFFAGQSNKGRGM